MIPAFSPEHWVSSSPNRPFVGRWPMPLGAAGRADYARFLLLKLPRRATGTGYDIEDEVSLRFYRLQKISEGSIALEDGEADPLKGPTEVGTRGGDDKQVVLSQLVAKLNDRFGRNLRNYGDRNYRQRTRQAASVETEDGQTRDPIDGLVAPPDLEPVLDMWNAILDWVRADPDGTLRQTCFKNRPEINAQVLLLQQLPPHTVAWDTIVARFNLSPADARYLPQWYSRHCNRLLRQFGKNQGYIE